MKDQIKARLRWVILYLDTKDAGLVCRKCGISRPTLRHWVRRYQKEGEAGLQSKTKRPHKTPEKKVTDQIEQWVLELRKRRLGSRRIQSELRRLHSCPLSRRTIQGILSRHQQPPLLKTRRPRKVVKRYAREVPGERVQIDTCEIANGLYQYSAIDDCTRMKVLKLYSEKSAENSLDFLEYVIEELPFPIQRIQTDRGMEFFAYEFQQRLMDYAIKFRPIKPRSPHLNGKVERSQKTDWDEFYSTVDFADPDLNEKLRQWQDYYNHERPHGSLKDRTPWEVWWELTDKTSLNEEVDAMYDITKERFKEQNYRADLAIQKLKGCR
jgi:transposase InsO family protein